MYIIFSSACSDYCLIVYTFAEGNSYPVCDVHVKLDLRFIVFSTVSSAANILLLASIFVIIAIVVRRRKSQGDDANSGNEGTEATAVYDEINLHPPLPPDIDSRENVAYRQTIFQEATTVYDEINLHPSSSADIDTKENVAYR